MHKTTKKPRSVQKYQTRLRTRPLSRFFYNRAYELVYYAGLFLTPSGWEKLSDPNIRKVLFSKEFGKGFLADSIIQNPLYIPDGEGGLIKKTVRAGSWAGYDFHRLNEFPNSSRQYREGKLGSMLLDEVRNNRAGTYTPTGLVDPLNVMHILCADFPSIEDLVKQELVRQTNYRSAFGRAGQYELYARSMDELEISGKPVFQVTPKGNSIVFLGDAKGDTTPPKKDFQLELSRI